MGLEHAGGRNFMRAMTSTQLLSLGQTAHCCGGLCQNMQSAGDRLNNAAGEEGTGDVKSLVRQAWRVDHGRISQWCSSIARSLFQFARHRK